MKGLKTIIVKVFIPGADKETHQGLVYFILVALVIAKCEISISDTQSRIPLLLE